MVCIAICDDAKQLVGRMIRAIEKYQDQTGREIKIQKYYSGKSLLADNPVNIDLIFLDINMPGMNGIETAKKLRENNEKISIIFLTSLIQYAIEGYKVNALNYILKPITYGRLKEELDSWFAKHRQLDEPTIVISNDTGKFRLRLKDIRYIETYNRNLLFHTEKEDIVSYRKLKEFESELKEYGFGRCHSGYLVNFLYIDTIIKLDAKLVTGEDIPISKLKRKEFMEELAAYWGRNT